MGKDTPPEVDEIDILHHLINDPDTKTIIKKNYRPTSVLTIGTKIFNKILANKIKQHMKIIMPRDQWDFFRG